MEKVCQLFSGSSGNSILVSSSGHNYLVDIGVSAKKCENGLNQIGIEPDSIEGIFVTHEHGDHAKGVRVFANRYKIPVYASKLCYDELYRQGFADDKKNLNIIENHIELDGIDAKAFHQSHDSIDCLGYRFNFADGRSAAVCTDTGFKMYGYVPAFTIAISWFDSINTMSVPGKISFALSVIKPVSVQTAALLPSAKLNL